MALEWKLRKVMAERNIWSGSELGRLIKDLAGYSLSAASISALINEQPKQVKAETMNALCTALECTPNDLWEFKMVAYKKQKTEKAVPIAKVANGKLPPI
jgi:DNA-binding Xre family transcriptional regulator